MNDFKGRRFEGEIVLWAVRIGTMIVSGDGGRYPRLLCGRTAL